MLTLTGRSDGYSAFGANNKYAFFPSVAAAWNIASESFMENAQNWLDQLKLRVSYGSNGNQAINPYQTLDRLHLTNYIWGDGGAGVNGAYLANDGVGNPNLKWETTQTFNVGIDYSFFNGRINGNIEMYVANTKDLLMKRTVPIMNGYKTIWDNVGKTRNKGVEFTLNTVNIRNKDFEWSTGIIFSLNRDKIVDLRGDKKDDITNKWFIGKPLRVYYDYDVDGITSTCVLTDYLRRQGVPVHPYIPDRIEEGYGLNMDAITNLQRTSDITLIITVDCGITAIDETNYALQRGIDMVITDHHECSGQAIPNAVAVVDPKRPGSQYPNSGLAGVGVAYKLLCALEGGSERVLREYGDLVAIGTVADVMPLTGENRYLVAQGLAQINARPRPGIRALLHECGAEGRPVTATTIGFTLAPRINAAGRLGKTAVAALLLLTNDDGEADRYAAGLCQLNRERQALEQQIWEEASAIACRYPPRMPLVLASDSWHQGVIGIAASRLSEEFHLPTIMICCDGERGKGSCRSFGGFNLYNALSACSEYLEGFGGHALAAGLTIRRENIDRFRRALGEYYRQNPADDLPELTCDLRVNDPHLLTMPCIESLDALEPCGNGNPKPLLCITGARLVNAVPIGGGRHLRLHFAKGGYNYAGIFFSCTPAQLGVRIGQWVDVAFTPQINEFRGRRSVQLLVTDVRPSDPLPLCRALLKNQCIPAWDTVDLYPLRADFAVAWRWLNAPVAFPLEELPARAPMRPEKFCVCLRVMAEMGLAAVDFDGETLRLRPLPTSGKVDLGASKLLQTLRERRQSLL